MKSKHEALVFMVHEWIPPVGRRISTPSGVGIMCGFLSTAFWGPIALSVAIAGTAIIDNISGIRVNMKSFFIFFITSFLLV